MKRLLKTIWLSALIFILTGCNLPKPNTGPTLSVPELINTSAAQTVQVLSTQLTGGQPMGTPDPNRPTIPPTVTLGSPLLTPEPGVATIAPPSDRAGFISDITVPDGLKIPPGSVFTKVWALKNTGTSTWDTNYKLVFANEGNAMNGPLAANLLTTGTVAPGEITLVEVQLTAPENTGTYRGYWQLQNANGVTFGLGETADQPFWVEIEVANEFNFIDNLCGGTWKNGSGTRLPCPGKPQDAAGFVYVEDEPKFENGYQDDEFAIIMGPQGINDGAIRGSFEPIRIPTGAHLMTIIGCVYDAADCNTRMKINYTVDGGPMQVLGEWNETADGSLTNIDIDLGALGLNGRLVAFEFIVEANGAANKDFVFWLSPRIKP
jgi:hypothetical protein